MIIHNHPELKEGHGGDVAASPADHAFTQWVKDRLAPFEDLRLLDHHVITAKSPESRSVDATPETTQGTVITEAWHATIDATIARLEAHKKRIATELQEAEPVYASDWHQRQAEFERQQAREPFWLQQIRESTRRRYAR